MRFRFAAAILIVLMIAGAAPVWTQEQPKADLFLGYSFLHPNVKAGQGIPGGFGAALTFNPSKPLGLTADFGFHRKEGVNTFTYMFGPKLTARGEKAMPFVEALFGGTRVSAGGLSTNGFAMGLGGGLDLKPWQYVGIRLLQVDYLLQRFSGNNAHGVRAQTGLLFFFGGGAPKATPSASCSAAPTEVMAGEPVTVTGTPANFNPKRTLTWSWNTTGGKAAGTGPSATIDTSGLAPGDYKVSGHVTDGKKEVADCSASFTVKEPPKHPPTLSCAPERSTVMSGEQIVVNCTGASPDQRPLTYAWQSSAGTVNAQGANATMASAGLTGPVTINTVVKDDRGLSAQATTSVTVQAPPPPPPPPPPAPGTTEAIRQELQQKGKALLNVHFDTAKATIRPDSEELLTNAAQVLKDDPQLYVFVDGYTDSRGGRAMNLALSRRRAAAVKAWLVQHGVEANRMVARGFGLDNPVGDNTTDEGRQANRRVEFVTMSEADKAKAQAAPKTPR